MRGPRRLLGALPLLVLVALVQRAPVPVGGQATGATTRPYTGVMERVGDGCCFGDDKQLFRPRYSITRMSKVDCTKACFDEPLCDGVSKPRDAFSGSCTLYGRYISQSTYVRPSDTFPRLVAATIAARSLPPPALSLSLSPYRQHVAQGRFRVLGAPGHGPVATR